MRDALSKESRVVYLVTGVEYIYMDRVRLQNAKQNLTGQEGPEGDSQGRWNEDTQALRSGTKGDEETFYRQGLLHGIQFIFTLPVKPHNSS